SLVIDTEAARDQDHRSKVGEVVCRVMPHAVQEGAGPMAIAASGTGRKFVRLTLWVALGTAAAATPLFAAGQSQSQRPLTFTKDIAPILQRSCQNCHRPGGGGPMSLLSFADVRPWA